MSHKNQFNVMTSSHLSLVMCHLSLVACHLSPRTAILEDYQFDGITVSEHVPNLDAWISGRG